MAKQTSTPKTPSSSDNASTSQNLESTTPLPQALEVDAPIISSEVYGTITAEAMEKDSYLTVDSRMDRSDITLKFSIKEAPEIQLNDVVDSSGQPGARKILIPLKHLTMSMGYTLIVFYEGAVSGKPAVSLVKEVGVTFYSAEQSKALAPRLRHEKKFQNTPTYDMHDHKGDEIVEIPVPQLAQVGDKIYCSVVTEQFSGKPVFYIVAYGYALTLDDIASGEKLEFPIPRGWLARQKPLYESITCQAAWITSGKDPQPPAEVENPDEETRLPRNALQIQHRRTAAFIGDQGLENLLPPHLRQSAFFDNKWCLNPALTKEGGDVDILDLDAYAGDEICFYVQGADYPSKPLGCLTIENDGDLASVRLSNCIVACFFNKPMTLIYTLKIPGSDKAQESPKQEVNVLVPQFPDPTIEEATGSTLDLRTFSRDATALVPVWDYAACSNRCWMWITGEYEDGSAYQLDILNAAPVIDDWKAHGIQVSIPRSELKNLADCSDFQLHYALSFCEACDREEAFEGPTATFHIVQEDLVLPKPKVITAVDDVLESCNGKDGVKVVVSYERMSPRQTIRLCWYRKDGSCWPLEPEPGTTKGSVVFTVPREPVIHAIGTLVKIQYTVTSPCKSATSEDLLLKVTVPQRLPTPVVSQATPVAVQNGILALPTFSGDADIYVEKWWFSLPGQRCWDRAVGTRQNGSRYVFDVFLAKPVTDIDGGIKDVVPRSHLAVLKNNSTLTFTHRSAPDGSTSESNAVTFPTLTLIFQAKYSDFTTFAGGNRNGWNDGAASQGENRFTTVFNKPCIANGTATSGTAGVILYKNLTGLERGRSYRASMLACTYNGAAPFPQLSLMIDGTTVTQIKTFVTKAWESVDGTFVATGPSMQLCVMSWLSSGASGNDFAVTDILVEDV